MNGGEASPSGGPRPHPWPVWAVLLGNGATASVEAALYPSKIEQTVNL